MRSKMEASILGALKNGTSERFELSDEGLKNIEKALESCLSSPGATVELERFLQLVIALSDRLASPATAEKLRALLTKTPLAMVLLREIPKKSRPIDARRNFAKQEGRSVALRAPVHDEAPPNGAIPLSNLINPLRAINGPRAPRPKLRRSFDD